MSDKMGPLRAGLVKFHEKRLSSGSYSSRSSQPGDNAAAGSPGPVKDIGSPTQFADERSGLVQQAQQQQRMHGAPDISWGTLCAEARAEADRKRGLSMRVQDPSDFQQWLMSDISQQSRAGALAVGLNRTLQ